MVGVRLTSWTAAAPGVLLMACLNTTGDGAGPFQPAHDGGSDLAGEAPMVKAVTISPGVPLVDGPVECDAKVSDGDSEHLTTTFTWRNATRDTQLVPRIRGFDRLLRHHSSSGSSARGTRTLRLRAAPGVLARRPRSASSTTMRCTDGAASPKNRAMSVSAGGWRLTFV